jgi:uncharacterized protein
MADSSEEKYAACTEERIEIEAVKKEKHVRWTSPVPSMSTVSREDKEWLDSHFTSLAWEKMAVAVAARNDQDKPAVLRMYPLRYDPKGRGSTDPVPWVNLYFLVCPRISSAIGRLEDKGFIEKFDQKLDSDPEFLHQYKHDHVAYAAERWALLNEDDKVYAEAKKYDAVLRDSGICGMTYWQRVKCLHAQYAYYLGAGCTTLVGRWIEEALKQPY